MEVSKNKQEDNQNSLSESKESRQKVTCESAFTVLKGEGTATKTFRATGGNGYLATWSAFHDRGIYVRDYSSATEWKHKRVVVSTIEDVHREILRWSERTDCFLIQGVTDSSACKVHRRYNSDEGHNDFYVSDSRLLIVDVDGFPGTLDEYRRWLPEWLQGVAHVVQLSSSAGIKPPVVGEDGREHPITSAHLFFMVDRAHSVLSLRDEMKRHNARRRDAYQDFCLGRGCAPKLHKGTQKPMPIQPLDTMAYSPVQPIYIASPIFVGLDRPPVSRVQLVSGRDFATLPDTVVTQAEFEAIEEEAEAVRTAKVEKQIVARAVVLESSPRQARSILRGERAAIEAEVREILTTMRNAISRHDTMRACQGRFASIEAYCARHGIRYSAPWDELEAAFNEATGEKRGRDFARAKKGARVRPWAPQFDFVVLPDSPPSPRGYRTPDEGCVSLEDAPDIIREAIGRAVSKFDGHEILLNTVEAEAVRDQAKDELEKVRATYKGLRSDAAKEARAKAESDYEDARRAVVTAKSLTADSLRLCVRASLGTGKSYQLADAVSALTRYELKRSIGVIVTRDLNAVKTMMEAIEAAGGTAQAVVTRNEESCQNFGEYSIHQRAGLDGFCVDCPFSRSCMTWKMGGFRTGINVCTREYWLTQQESDSVLRNRKIAWVVFDEDLEHTAPVVVTAAHIDAILAEARRSPTAAQGLSDLRTILKTRERGFCQVRTTSPDEMGFSKVLSQMSAAIIAGLTPDEKLAIVARADKQPRSAQMSHEHLTALWAFFSEDSPRAALSGDGGLSVRIDRPLVFPPFANVCLLDGTATEETAGEILGDRAEFVRVDVAVMPGCVGVEVVGTKVAPGLDGTVSGRAQRLIDALRGRAVTFAQKAVTALVDDWTTYYQGPESRGSNAHEGKDVAALPFFHSTSRQVLTGYDGAHREIVQALGRARPTRHTVTLYNATGRRHEASPLHDFLGLDVIEVHADVLTWLHDESSPVTTPVVNYLWEGLFKSETRKSSVHAGGMRVQEKPIKESSSMGKPATIMPGAQNLAMRVLNPESPLKRVDTAAHVHTADVRTSNGVMVIPLPTSWSPSDELILEVAQALNPGATWVEYYGARVATHDALEDVQQAIQAGATSLRGIAEALGETRLRLTGRIENQVGRGNATTWLANQVAAQQADNVTRLTEAKTKTSNTTMVVGLSKMMGCPVQSSPMVLHLDADTRVECPVVMSRVNPDMSPWLKQRAMRG